MESLHTLAAMNMKKQAKTKLNKIWAKIRKPLMILSFVGNILFLLFIIVGCVGSKKQAQPTNAEDTPQVFTLRNTRWKLNDEIRLSPNGNQFLTASNYYVETYNIFYTTSANEDFFNSELIFSGFPSGNVPHHLLGAMYLDETFEHNVGLLEQHYFALSDTFSQSYLNGFDGVISFLDDDYEDAQHPATDFENELLINWFCENATLLTDYELSNFTFLSQINYNGLFGQPIDSMFINANNTGGTNVVIDLPFFMSNGQLFNRIKCWYLNGYSMRYIDTNGQIVTQENNQTWYFLEMEYINTATNLSVIVNYRNFVVGNATSLTKGSTWKGGSYRYLSFQNPLTPEQRTSLESLNNDNYSGFSGEVSDVGLSNVFGLLGQAFISLRGLLSIELLPNITIGLLVFMPLIVGIILTIIWVVKR